MHGRSTAPCVTVDASGTILTVDEPFASLLVAEHKDLVGCRLSTLGHTAEDEKVVIDCLESVASEQVSSHVRVRLRATDGRDVDSRLVVTPSGDGSLTVLVIDDGATERNVTKLARLQRRWLSLLRSSTDLVFATDDEGRLTALTWAQPDRVAEDTDHEVDPQDLPRIHPEDEQLVRQAWLDISGGEHAQAHLEVRLLHTDDRVTWGSLVLRDLRDDPDVQSIVGTVADATERRRQERRRHLHEARFRDHFHQSPLPQVLQTIDGRYAEVNDAFCQLLGRSRDQLTDVPATEVTHPDDPGDAERALVELRHGHIEWAQVDRLLMDADGQPVPVRIDATSLRDGDGRPNGCAASLQDLRPLRDSELARTQLQSYFDVVAERSSDIILIFDAEGRSRYASPAGHRMFGDVFGSDIADLWQLVHPDDRSAMQAAWAAVLGGGAKTAGRYRVRRADGTSAWIDQAFTNLLDTDIGGVMSTARDITAQVEATEALRVSEASYRAIAETAEEGILVIASDGVVTYANARLASILGLAVEDVTGQPAWTIFEGETADLVRNRLKGRRSRGSERYELPYLHPDGSQRDLLVAASPMPPVDGIPQGSLAMISDITEQRRSERELRHAAEHDELTGLLNRAMLMEHLEHTDTEGTAVLFIDLDHFKDVNDGRGHTAGDSLLIEVARRLTAAVRASDIVARFGGDEFVVVLNDVDEDVALSTARRVLDILSTAYRVGHHTIRIGATIGIALTPAPSADDLLRFADTAMYAAKASGRGRVRLFDVALAEQAEERYTLGAELQAAIANNELEMHYQPVLSLATGQVDGVESLARWHHPTRGPIGPDRFIPLAELTASAADLDRWAVRQALNDFVALKADGTVRQNSVISVNLSGQSLAEGLDTFIIETARDAGIEPHLVSLKITESAIMADKDIAVEVLQKLRDQGFWIAIDDFGTGYSSMAYLRELPISALKIDRGFVRGIPEDAHSLAIVTSLIQLAQSLDLLVIAEGVENAAHRDALFARGCPIAQGFLWSAAMSPAQLRETGIMMQMFEPAKPPA